MSPGALVIFQVNLILPGQCIDKALQQEAANVLSGQSNHENSLIEAVVFSLPQEPDPFMTNIDLLI